jgi:hypothetical protein
MNTQPVKEPNFEGEEMKIPASVRQESSAQPSNTSVLSGPIIAVLGIILLIIFGGLSYWYYLVITTTDEVIDLSTRPTAEENNEPESTTAEARTDALDVVSTSDEIGAIEADVLSTNLDELDAELTAIDAELNAALEALPQ